MFSSSGPHDESAPAREPAQPTRVEVVRAWVARRVEQTSYRQMAERLGVAKSSLEKFVRHGAYPVKNWARLRAGYLRDRAEAGGGLAGAADFDLLLAEAVSAVPAPRRGRAMARLVRELDRIHLEEGAPRPAWLERLSGAARDHDRTS